MTNPTDARAAAMFATAQIVASVEGKGDPKFLEDLVERVCRALIRGSDPARAQEPAKK